MKPHQLKALLDNAPGAPFLTVKQRERVRKHLSKEKVQVTVTMSGGEFLHLVDVVGSVEGIDPFLHEHIRELMKGLTGIPWGSPYEIPVPEGEEPPPLGKRTRMKLNRGQREIE